MIHLVLGYLGGSESRLSDVVSEGILKNPQELRTVDKFLDDGFLGDFRVLEELLHHVASVFAHREGDEVPLQLGDDGRGRVGHLQP